MRPPSLAVTFDFGQTLCELDVALLVARLSERGITARADQLDGAVTDAWRAYDAAIAAGLGGHPWKTFMAHLLESAGVAEPARGDAVDWLWTEQPGKNLWRRPIAGMIELCRMLTGAGVPVGIVSNSEGRLAELVAEVGWADDFTVIADSGRLGMEKPDAPIFRWAAERLDTPLDRIVHVGDSWGADVEGALRAGMRAIWFRPRIPQPVTGDIRCADEASGVRVALAEWGIG